VSIQPSTAPQSAVPRYEHIQVSSSERLLRPTHVTRPRVDLPPDARECLRQGLRRMKVPLTGLMLVGYLEVNTEDLKRDEPKGERGEVPCDRRAIGGNQRRWIGRS
jgi:hypothetical protein